VTLSSQGFLKRFWNIAIQCGVESRVEYVGVHNREKLFQMSQTCHLGLSLFRRKFVEPMVGASNKPFDYLACGMPLLINDTPEWTHFFGPWGVAKSCNPESPESIASAIRGLIENPEEYQQMRNRAVQKISSDWNYESQFAPIKKILEA
jgi:glycosyltransferase involved in cell wall biosynthesis